MRLVYVIVALLAAWTVGILALYGAFKLYGKYFS